MITLFWTLFFLVVILLLFILIAVYSILDGIKYHEDMKKQRFDQMSGQDPDWMKDKDGLD